jgi:transposase-like protein
VTQPIERDPVYRRRRFPRDVIETCVRWYLTYRLSYRDLVSLMAEREVHVTHTTIMRWVFTIRTRIREAVEPQGEAGRFVLARRRDLHSHPAQDGLLVSCS